MPIYEYACKECETKFEKFVRSANSTVQVKCPHCGGADVKKGWSIFGTGKASIGLGSVPAQASSGCSTGGT